MPKINALVIGELLVHVSIITLLLDHPFFTISDFGKLFRDNDMSPVKTRLLAAAVLAIVAIAASSSRAQSQTIRYAVNPKASLAWWQINPNMNHLWATTCPDDPSWQPGEGRSPGYYVDYWRRHKTADAAVSDLRIPLYPRKRLRYVCRQAVVGQVDVSDTTTWHVTGGKITVLADSLVTGLDYRDNYARKQVFETRQFPSITFQIDSLTNRQMKGDTLDAVAVGTFELRGVRTPMKATLRAWRDAGGLRVQSKAQFPARDLIDVYLMSKQALAMGVSMSMWRDVYYGVDVLLNRVTSPNGD